jgi:predicted nucleotidyltransferase
MEVKLTAWYSYLPVPLDHLLDNVLASASHVRVLRALFGLPRGIGRSGRDLARRAGISHPRASQVLADLTRQGLVRVERLPRTDLYQLNNGHVLMGPLGQLFELEAGLTTDLIKLIGKELRARRLPVKQALIFGSAARDAMTSHSDVDLALVTSPDTVDAVEAAGGEIAEAARDRFGARVSVLVGSPSLERLAQGRQGRRAVWAAIAREGIEVLANPRASS